MGLNEMVDAPHCLLAISAEVQFTVELHSYLTAMMPFCCTIAVPNEAGFVVSKNLLNYDSSILVIFMKFAL